MKKNERHSNLEIFLTISGMTLMILGLLTIFLSYVLKLQPSLFWPGLITMIIGGIAMFINN